MSFCRAFIAAEREFLGKWSRKFPFFQQGQVRGDENRTGGFGRGAGQGEEREVQTADMGCFQWGLLGVEHRREASIPPWVCQANLCFPGGEAPLGGAVRGWGHAVVSCIGVGGNMASKGT